MKAVLLSLFILIGSKLIAQDTCSCACKLDALISMVSHDYAGYYDKVINTDRTRYQALIDSLRGAARAAAGGPACSRLQETYCAFFQDKQLRLGRTPEADNTDPKPPTTSWTAASLTAYFDAHMGRLRELEGMWSFETYDAGLVYVDTLQSYQAVITRSIYPNWKEGMLKFTLALVGPDSVAMDYWKSDMTFVKFKDYYRKGHIALRDMGVLHQVKPAPSDAIPGMAFELEHGYDVQWRVLEDSTLYLKVGSCRQKNKAVIDSLVKVNAAQLDHLPEWIIDLRHNASGSSAVFQGLVPYLYTTPYRGPEWKYWLSAENTKLLRSGVDLRQRTRHQAVDRSYVKMIRYAEKHPDTWSGSWASTFKFDSVRSMPRRIAILTDASTAGNAEIFLIEARGMSGRTIIVGENTAGAADYGHPIERALGNEVVLRFPITRMDWLDQGISYDRTGIRPDVPVGNEVGDKVGFVRNYWRTH